ncbi:hypothetical protein LTS17_004581 [Exophiala oligosperma]
MASQRKDQVSALQTKKVIYADLLIPGRGEPQKNAALTYSHGKISYVGSQGNLPEEFRNADITRVPVLLPGLWDCHVHFFGAKKQSFKEFTSVSQILAGARSAHDASRTLDAGFTSVREMAGYGLELSKAIEEGLIVGPRIYSSHAALSITGGHVDPAHIPIETLEREICHGLFFALADGVDGCTKAVRLQVRRGAHLIKVCASGGITSRFDNPEHAQFSDAELKAVVEEARRSDRIVAAHCHGLAGIMAALRAGCHTIEHGTYLDDGALGLMKDQGAILVPTRTVFEAVSASPESMEPESYTKLSRLVDAHQAAYKKAVASGVKIALGSDIGLSSRGTGFTHGDNGKELVCAVEAGLTPLQAIEAATAMGPQTLGPTYAPLSGQLKEGYDADLIVLSGNPLEDINVFADPRNITHVWKGGTLFKAPGMPVLSGYDTQAIYEG